MSEAPHTVKSYEEELKNLNANIIKMGSACAVSYTHLRAHET